MSRKTPTINLTIYFCIFVAFASGAACAGIDSDCDGVADAKDNCPDESNPGQSQFVTNHLQRY